MRVAAEEKVRKQRLAARQLAAGIEAGTIAPVGVEAPNMLHQTDEKDDDVLF